ncbi:MAG: alpha-N-arabinofuranosidase [Phycisphaeraceae bacterium]|nr:MAG: alpha-N-arabinofuranosidase [Phycisphaeraceae bacterium]
MQRKGVWGPIHRLHADAATGPWTLDTPPIITERAEGPALAKVGDETLLYVDFYTQGRYGAYATKDWKTWRDVSNEVKTVKGQRHGSIIKVPRALVEGLLRGPEVPPITLRVDPDAPGKPISPDLFGIFFEDINDAADGGLYAELVRNRSFEFNATERSDWNAMTGWEMTTHGGGGWPVIDVGEPLDPNNPHYVVVHATDVRGPGVGLVNGGFAGLAVEEGRQYRFSMFARQPYMGGRWDGDKSIEGKPMPVVARLESDSGEVLGEAHLDVAGRDWRRVEATITATKTDANAKLAVLLTQRGGLAMDMISLFPQHTFKDQPNGLRADLAQTIADLHPAFIRFPGGCLVHGDGLYNMYNWKDTIGPVEQRRGQKNIWGYHQSVGLGYYEYFQFCEDIGAKPVPIVAAGVCCQNAGQVGGIGQRGLPMDEMPAYVQDVLDLIEWANGPASSEWGAKRAAAGHPEPFGLEYLGVGNEDAITPEFEERFKMIYEAVGSAHPEITVIGTVGPAPRGEDFDKGWAIARDLAVPIVDEHYYVSPEWFWDNLHRYDGYDRSGPHVYLGEYAAHERDRRPTLRCTLAEAAYLTSLERNGDVVRMSSYAPLLGKAGHTQWNPDLIYFDNTTVAPTVDYYGQQLFSRNGGDRLLPADTEGDAKAFACSAVRDSDSGDVILKVVNARAGSRSVRIELSDASRYQSDASVTVLASDDLLAVNTLEAPDTVVPRASSIGVADTIEYQAPANSLSVIRLHPR